MQIEPDGTVEIISTFEKMIATPLVPCGFKVPKTSLENLNVSTLRLYIRSKQFVKVLLKVFITKEILDLLQSI